jgi:hypothetical protein
MQDMVIVSRFLEPKRAYAINAFISDTTPCNMSQAEFAESTQSFEIIP